MSKALSRHISKLLETVGSGADITVDFLYDNLTRNHLLYKLDPESELRDSILKELQSIQQKALSVPTMSVSETSTCLILFHCLPN